jgi:hypothetical protein
MSFCTITPTRGDRPALLEFCKHQISRMTLKPDQSLFIDFEPKNTGVDLVERIIYGFKTAIAAGHDEVFILEDDDFYPADYFETMKLGDADFIGQDTTTYYNLRNRTWQTMSHPKRSSLFITGFKIEALRWDKEFTWPNLTERFLDISLWKHAEQKKLKTKFVQTEAIGIKHNIGLCGGRGHVMNMKKHDKDMEWLKSKVDNEAFIFYKSLNL